MRGPKKLEIDLLVMAMVKDWLMAGDRSNEVWSREEAWMVLV